MAERDLNKDGLERARAIAEPLVAAHSQTWLAEQLGMSPSGVSKLMSRTQGLGVQHALRLCALAKVDPSEVLGEELTRELGQLMVATRSVEREADAVASGIVAGLVAARGLDPALGAALLPRVRKHLGHFSDGSPTAEQQRIAGSKALTDLDGFISDDAAPAGTSMIVVHRASIAERVSAAKRKKP